MHTAALQQRKFQTLFGWDSPANPHSHMHKSGLSDHFCQFKNIEESFKLKVSYLTKGVYRLQFNIYNLLGHFCT